MAISKEQPMRPALIDVVDFMSGESEAIDRLDDVTSEHTEQIEAITEVQAQFSQELQTEIQARESGDAQEAQTREEADTQITSDVNMLRQQLNTLSSNIYPKSEVDALVQALETAINGKQDTLVSGTNIKTVNSQSILGSGNIEPEFMRLDFNQELTTELLPITDDTAVTSNTGRVDVVLPAEYQANWAIVDLNKYELKNGSTRVEAVPMFKITMSGQTIIRIGFKTSGNTNKQVDAISGGLLLIRRS